MSKRKLMQLGTKSWSPADDPRPADHSAVCAVAVLTAAALSDFAYNIGITK